MPTRVDRGQDDEAAESPTVRRELRAREAPPYTSHRKSPAAELMDGVYDAHNTTQSAASPAVYYILL